MNIEMMNTKMNTNMNIQFSTRRQFFDSYAERHIEQKATFQIPVNRFSCPCCGFPTLSSRGDYELCRLCCWEDDGQDTFNAGEILGGFNHDYSLASARRNFERYLTIYTPENDTRDENVESERERELKLNLISAFGKIMNEPNVEELKRLWKEVDKIEKAIDKEIDANIREYETQID